VRVVLQRVSRAAVRIAGAEVGRVEEGLLLLVGFTGGDGEAELVWMADKVAGLRIFPDDEGKMNRSVNDARGGALVVSQFTLYGDTRKGRRPSFVAAAHPDVAVPLYERFVALLRERIEGPVETGEFGAMMEVELVNDGPVTLVLEREPEGESE
jgi:D-aminoacyl-tRNA deacylase